MYFVSRMLCILLFSLENKSCPPKRATTRKKKKASHTRANTRNQRNRGRNRKRDPTRISQIYVKDFMKVFFLIFYILKRDHKKVKYRSQNIHLNTKIMK